MEKYSNIICFGAGTVVATPTGGSSIENLKTNDIIMSYNFISNQVEQVRITCVAESVHSINVVIRFSNGSQVSCTLDHPFWVNGKEWCSVTPRVTNENYNLKTGQLLIGDVCKCFFNDTLGTTQVVSIEEKYGEFTMYIVGSKNSGSLFANGILVHDEDIAQLGLSALDSEYVRVHSPKRKHDLTLNLRN